MISKQTDGVDADPNDKLVLTRRDVAVGAILGLAALAGVGTYVANLKPDPEPQTASGETKLFGGLATLKVVTKEHEGKMKIVSGDLIVAHDGVVKIQCYRPIGDSNRFSPVDSANILQICRRQPKGSEYTVALPNWIHYKLPENVAVSIEYRPDSKSVAGGTEEIPLKTLFET